MADDKTFSVTFTMHLTEPLTEKEKSQIIGNLWDHIHNECEDGIAEAFGKIAEVDSPDGKYQGHVGDMWDKLANMFQAEGHGKRK